MIFIAMMNAYTFLTTAVHVVARAYIDILMDPVLASYSKRII